MDRHNNKSQTTSLLFIRTPTDLVSPLVSPSVRFSFEDLEWKPQKSSLKKPGLRNSCSTPSKEKRVRFSNVSSKIFYPAAVTQFYQNVNSSGVFITPDNKITRHGMFLVLFMSFCSIVSGFMAYSGGLLLLAVLLFSLSFVLIIVVTSLILHDITHRRTSLKVRCQKLGP